MPRPRKKRCLGSAPPATFYKPQGVPLSQLRGTTLRMEGFEALRLVDAQGLSQEEAAMRMEVSRPTLCRVLGEARAVVAKALSNGWALRIEDLPEEQEGPPGNGGRRGGCKGRGRGCVQNSGREQPEHTEES